MGQSKDHLEFASQVTRVAYSAYQPRIYYPLRRRGWRRHKTMNEVMVPGYLFVDGDVDLLLSAGMCSMKLVGRVPALEVARMVEMERQSLTRTLAFIRDRRKPGKAKQFPEGAHVLVREGIFQDRTLRVVRQHGRMVELAPIQPDETLLFGKDAVKLDVSFLQAAA